jgi:hypothetical protein
MDQSRRLSCSTSLYLYSYTSRLDEDGVQKNSLFEPLWAKLNYRENMENAPRKPCPTLVGQRRTPRKFLLLRAARSVLSAKKTDIVGANVTSSSYLPGNWHLQARGRIR